VKAMRLGLVLPALAALATLVVVAAAAPVSAASPPWAAAVERARTHAIDHSALTHFGRDQDLVARDVVVDGSGAHVRFDRTFRGLRVIGGDLVVHDRPDGDFGSVSQTLDASVEDVAAAPAVPAGEALRQALARFVGRPSIARPELVVWARSAVPKLAYEVVVSGDTLAGDPSELHVVLDARSAQVLESWDAIETAAGTGNGFFNGTVALQTTPISGGFSLKDPTRGNQYTCDMRNRTRTCTLFTDADNAWGNGTLSDRATVGVDAQYGTAVTWDYYRTIFGRNGIANDGRGAFNRVHYSNRYNNAFWSDSCFCMTYGDGDGTTFNPFDSLDVAGHEMSHGVTSRTARLVYSGESGGLNEATSDIFGTMVEFFANNSRDVGDYKIGEKLYRSNPGESRALRYMYNPGLDGRSANCWSSGVGGLDVHYSSGVANHFFYLLAQGSNASPASPTCNGQSVTGIGRDAAQRIWYRALTVYMTSSTNYHGARTATLNAARDLYGTGSAQSNTVNAAWAAVSVT
jgi:Zn-dependent metalloprotease